MTTRVDLRADALMEAGLDPWVYRCAWTFPLRILKENPDWQIVDGAEQWIPQDLSGSTLRWVVASSATETATSLQTLERTEGAAGGDGQIVFTDAVDGRAEVRMSVSDNIAAVTNAWVRVFLALPGESRTLKIDGFIDIVAAQGPDANVNVNV